MHIEDDFLRTVVIDNFVRAMHNEARFLRSLVGNPDTAALLTVSPSIRGSHLQSGVEEGYEDF